MLTGGSESSWKTGDEEEDQGIRDHAFYSNRPLVVVLGATGCGKTKLSIEICKRFDGEVISTDSMQVYEGLNIATNKVTEEESNGVVHHMISFLHPLTLGYTVVHFRNRALRIIRDIYKRNKLPVLVGGTNYYNEAILWKTLLSDDIDDKPLANYAELMRKIPFDFLKLSDEELHEELKKVDPIEASVVHPKFRRRVLRCLQYFYDKGRPISEELRKQHSEEGASCIGGPMRFKNTCVLWLQCDEDILHSRLNVRVDEMVSKGLKTELINFYDRFYIDFVKRFDEFNSTANEADSWTKGVFQSIGLKEFRAFLSLPTEERKNCKGKKFFEEGVEQLKLNTRKYAKYQNKWIRRRFLATERDSPSIYGLNANCVETYEDVVLHPALEIVKKFLKGEKQSMEPVERLANVIPNADDRQLRLCIECDRLIVGNQWTTHISSKGHRAIIGRIRKEEKQKLMAEYCKLSNLLERKISGECGLTSNDGSTKHKLVGYAKHKLDGSAKYELLESDKRELTCEEEEVEEAKRLKL